MLSLKNQKGLMALVLVLVVSSVAIILAISASFLGLGELEMGFNERRSTEALAFGDACLDEALLRLKRDNAYSGGSLSIDGNSCTITITPSGDLRTIGIESNVGEFTKNLEAEADVSASYIILNYYKEIP